MIKFYKFLFLLLCCFSAINLFSFTSDSLRLSIKNSKSVEQKINFYLDIGDNFEFENPDSAIYYYTQAKNLSFENIDKSEKTKILYIVSIRLTGFIYDNLGNYEKAIELFQKTIDIIIDFKNNSSEEFKEQLNYQLSSSYSNIGSTYTNLSKYDQAMIYYQKSLKISEESFKSNNKQIAFDALKGIGKSHNNLGIIQLVQKNYESALEYFEKSIEYKTKVNDSLGICACYNNIGVIYLQLKEFDKSIEYHNKALKIYERLNDIKGIGSSYSNIASIYRITKKSRGYWGWDPVI